MKITETKLEGAAFVVLEPKGDIRGSLTRLYDLEEFDGLSKTGMRIVQINHQYTKTKGTIRGLHYRIPYEQKAVKCIRGMAWDVIVDIRKESPTYLKWDARTLFPEDLAVVYVPRGFAHGTQTLMDDTELLYFHSDFYDHNFEKGIRFDDPKLNIVWLLSPELMSMRDLELPNLEKSDA